MLCIPFLGRAQSDAGPVGARISVPSRETHPVMASAFNAQAGGGYCRPELPEQTADLLEYLRRAADRPGRLGARHAEPAGAGRRLHYARPPRLRPAQRGRPGRRRTDDPRALPGDTDAGRGAAPLVSVVTPVWNAAATLREAVASVRAQTLARLGAHPRRRRLDRRLARPRPGARRRGARIRPLAREPNGGAAAARNDAIRAARGRLHRLPRRRRPLASREARPPGCLHGAGGHALVYSPTAGSTPAAGRSGWCGRRPGSPAPRSSRSNVIGCLTAVFDAAVFGQAEMPPLRRRQDYGLWLPLLRTGALRPRPARGARRLPGAPRLALGRQAWLGARDLDTLPRDRGPEPRPRAAYYLAHNLARALAKRASLAASAAQEDRERRRGCAKRRAFFSAKASRTGAAARPKTRAKTSARARAWRLAFPDEARALVRMHADRQAGRARPRAPRPGSRRGRRTPRRAWPRCRRRRRSPRRSGRRRRAPARAGPRSRGSRRGRRSAGSAGAGGAGALARPAVGVERAADEEVDPRVLGEEAADAGDRRPAAGRRRRRRRAGSHPAPRRARRCGSAPARSRRAARR